jgi:hypothetical protein
LKSIAHPGILRLPRLLGVFLILLVSSLYGRGQATSGQIAGQVTDTTGAVIRGATITITDEAKGVTFSGVTDAAGNFTVVSIPPSVYTVSASAPGFAESRFEHATLSIDQHLALNFKLKVGSASATIEVTDTAQVLQTQTAEVGTVIGGDSIVDLPLEGRDFYALTMLVPGVAQVGGSINSFALSVSGQREFSNSIQLDGIETTTNRTQDVTVEPNVDSVQEFKVITAAYNAEFGNASGGVVAVQTKAGTNKIHGDAFEFFRPNFLTARETLPGVNTPQPAPVLKQHNFGGTLGGPIKRDRAFLFGAYEGMRQKNAYAYVDSTIPFGLFDVGSDGSVDFSRLVDPCAGQQCTDNNGNPSGPPAGTVDPIFDPNVSVQGYGYVTEQFTGNVIPASRVSPSGLNTLLNFFPKPNLTGIKNGWFRNYAVFSPTSANQDKVDARYDQVITTNDRLYAVFHWQADDQLVTDPYYGNTVVPGAGDADQANHQDDGVSSISLTYDHVFSPTALNEIRAGYLRYYQNQYSLLNGTDYSTKFGVGNVFVQGYPATVGYPQIYMGDGYLAGGSTYKPYHVKDSNNQYSDVFTWSGVPKHELKFGFDLRQLNSRPVFSLFPTGFDYFDSFGYAQTSDYAYTTFIPGGYNWSGGSDIADLVLGLPQDVDMGLQLTNPHTQSWNLDWYAQDSFKVTPNLVLNFGLRYEYYAPWTEANNYMSNYSVASNQILLAGRGSNSTGLVASRKNQFSPRFGFAYTINPKTVIRAGEAIFYSPENDGREDFMTMNVPFATQAAYSNWIYNGPASATSLWQYQLDTGVPRSTAINIPSSGVIDPANLANGNLETTYAINPSIKTGTTGSFDLAVERQLSRTMALSVSYIGSISRHLSYEVGDINANPNNSANNYDNALTTSLGKIQYLTDVGNSNFHSLQVKLSRQMSRNASFLVSYTYGHSLDNGPAPFNLGHINSDSPQNPNNLTAEYATSDTDLRHNFILSGTYKLPFGTGQTFGNHWGAITNAILGGWRYSPIFIMRSGTPVNVVRGTNPASILPGLRPDVTGDPNLPRGKRNILRYFNTGAFSVPAAISGSSFLPGTASRNMVGGPGYINLDSSLAKTFTIEGRYNLEVRAEAFNTSNTVHYSNPDGNFNSGTFGQITSVIGNSNRVAQLAAKFIF